MSPHSASARRVQGWWWAVGAATLVAGCMSGAGDGGAGGTGGTTGVGGVGGKSVGSGGASASGGALGTGGSAGGVAGSGGNGGSVAGSGGSAPVAGSSGGGGKSPGTGGLGVAGHGGAGGAPSSGAGGSVGVGGSTATGGAGGGVAMMATDYMARKWARWPIPNPPSLAGYPHPMSYTDGTDGVLDTVTGLRWQKSTNAATTTWQDALAYCQTLGDGWSLPTRLELTSILDNTQSGAKVNGVFKFGNKAGWTWASTPWVVNARKNLTGDAALSWFINFSQGDSNNSLSQTAASAYARCVKLPTGVTLPATHYAIAAGEVTDNFTGLVWQQGASGTTASLSWDAAKAYCAGLALNGQTYRLPSLNELASIVDDVPTGNVSPAVDHTAFPSTSSNGLYWSASGYGTSTTEFWTLNFEDGFTAHNPATTMGMARCVR